MAKILVVEDEIRLARFVELELLHEGYEVITVHDGREGYDLIMDRAADLVVLDVMLPSMSGFEVLKKIRKAERDVPVIMLTAKGEISDKVNGLDLGADDYMTKPFAIEELLARIRKSLARADKEEKKKPQTIGIGKLSLNLSSHEAFYDGETLNLTKKEFELLAYLLENRNTAMTRETILNVVWGYDYLGDTNVVDVYIRYLRQKIDDKYGEKIIGTVRGVGYIIKDEESGS